MTPVYIYEKKTFDRMGYRLQPSRGLFLMVFSFFWCLMGMSYHSDDSCRAMDGNDDCLYETRSKKTYAYLISFFFYGETHVEGMSKNTNVLYNQVSYVRDNLPSFFCCSKVTTRNRSIRQVSDSGRSHVGRKSRIVFLFFIVIKKGKTLMDDVAPRPLLLIKLPTNHVPLFHVECLKTWLFDDDDNHVFFSSNAGKVFGDDNRTISTIHKGCKVNRNFQCCCSTKSTSTLELWKGNDKTNLRWGFLQGGR